MGADFGFENVLMSGIFFTPGFRSNDPDGPARTGGGGSGTSGSAGGVGGRGGGGRYGSEDDVIASS